MRGFLVSAILFVAFLAGCASPPSVRESSLLFREFAGTDRLVFVYRNVTMKTVSSYSFGNNPGRGTASFADTGFDDFGKLVVGQATGVFAERKVNVPSARLLEGNAALQGLPGESQLPILVVEPYREKKQASSMSTVASYEFSAQLMDPASRRLVWKAKIDANAWIGQDFVMKNFEKKALDGTQARSFLKAIAEKMAEDGVIR